MPFVNIGDLRTRYELTGTGRGVLMLSSSLGTDFTMWNPQLADFEKKFRVLRYDTRGHGQSSVTPGDYTIDQLGRDVISLLDILKLERIHFCGLSMGGMVGMWLGINTPGRLNRLVLCNTAARIGTKEMWNARIATVRNQGMKVVAAAVIERWFTPEFRKSEPEKTAHAQRMLENSPAEGYAACCAAVRDMDQRAGLAKIGAPTLVIYGGKDPVSPVADALFLKEQIRGAAAVELDAAHLSNVEQPQAFSEAVCDFLCR